VHLDLVEDHRQVIPHRVRRVNSRGDDDHRRELAAEDRGEHWQQLRQGSARTDDQILIYRSRWSGTASCAGAAFKAESTFDEPSLTSLALRLSTRPPIVI
jgi:hypothetical protein